MRIIYRFPKFNLTYDSDTGEAITHYPDGTKSGVGTPSAHDEYHGNLLGLSPGEHHLQHELAHHLVGDLTTWPGGKDGEEPLRYGGCPIARLSAIGGHIDEELGRQRETLITAVQYASQGLPTAEVFVKERMGMRPGNYVVQHLGRLMHYALLSSGEEPFSVEVGKT